MLRWAFVGTGGALFAAAFIGCRVDDRSLSTAVADNNPVASSASDTPSATDASAGSIEASGSTATPPPAPAAAQMQNAEGSDSTRVPLSSSSPAMSGAVAMAPATAAAMDAGSAVSNVDAALATPPATATCSPVVLLEDNFDRTTLGSPLVGGAWQNSATPCFIVPIIPSQLSGLDELGLEGTCCGSAAHPANPTCAVSAAQVASLDYHNAVLRFAPYADPATSGNTVVVRINADGTNANSGLRLSFDGGKATLYEGSQMRLQTASSDLGGGLGYVELEIADGTATIRLSDSGFPSLGSPVTTAASTTSLTYSEHGSISALEFTNSFDGMSIDDLQLIQGCAGQALPPATAP